MPKLTCIWRSQLETWLLLNKCLTNTRHAVCLASMATMRIIPAYIAHYIAVRHKIWRLLVSSHVNGNFYICTIRKLNINIPSWLTSSGQPCQNPFRSQSCWQLRHSLKLRAGGDINHSVSFNGVNCTNIEYQESVSTLKYPRNHVDQRCIDVADQEWGGHFASSLTLRSQWPCIEVYNDTKILLKKLQHPANSTHWSNWKWRWKVETSLR